MGGRVAAFALAVGLFLVMPGVTLAHASFVRSEPADVCGPLAVPRLEASDTRCQTGVVLQQAPAEVRVSFSEPVQPVGRGIRVISPSGKPVQQGKATAQEGVLTVPIAAAEPGTYVVEWQVESSDTHPVRGRFAFSVGQPSAPTTTGSAEVGQVTPLGLALQTLGRWLHFAGFVLAFGSVGVSALLTRFAPSEVLGPRRRWQLINAGILLLVLSEPVMLLGQTGSLGADQLFDGDAIGDALASLFGRLLGFRLAAALLLWVIGGSLQPPFPTPAYDSGIDTEGQPPPEALDQRLATGAALALGLAVAVIDALGQHAASFRPEWLGLAVHAIHLSGMAVWLAAVIALLVGSREHSLKAPFTGRIAVLGVILVAVSGLAMAIVHIPSPDQLIASPYGIALSVKQVVLLVVLALAWGASRCGGLKARTGESAALTVILGLAAVLVSLPPPR